MIGWVEEAASSTAGCSLHLRKAEFDSKQFFNDMACSLALGPAWTSVIKHVTDGMMHHAKDVLEIAVIKSLDTEPVMLCYK